MKSTERLEPMLQRILAAGIQARYLLMDSWFGMPATIALLSTISSAISGDNYANIQLPEFKAELRRNEKLLCLEAEGVSDYSSTQYIARYDKGIGEVWRALYPDDSEAQLTQQI